MSYELSLFRFLALKSLTMGGFLEVRQKKYEFNILQNLLEGMGFIYARYFQIACDYYYYPSAGAGLRATFKQFWHVSAVPGETDYSIN